MELAQALQLHKGDEVIVKRKNQYTPEWVGTVIETEIIEIDGVKYVGILLDDGNWYGYQEVK